MIIRKLYDRIVKFLGTRVFMVGMMLFLQFIILLSTVFLLSEMSNVIKAILYIFNVLITLRIINRFTTPTYKLAWTLIILGLPLAGGIIYMLFAEKKVPKKLRGKVIEQLSENVEGFYDKKCEESDDIDVKEVLNYVKNNGHYPYYKNTRTKYYPDGQEFFDDMIEDLDKAKHFVFMEFFIVKEGSLLEEVLEALRRCVMRDVKVYFMYDDAGCITCLPPDFSERLKSYGINAVNFSPVNIRLSLLSNTNNRSHRKIIVIDNKIAYTGGFNLADEYVNREVRFGHWKDTGIRLYGEAVWNFTVMYIQLFNAHLEKNKELDYRDFKLEYNFEKTDSLVLPFSDSPTDEEDICRNTHMNFIRHAHKYIYMHTPYLIIEYDMVNSLCLAAKNGVEVIITTPHIPDKKTVFEVTRSHYEILIKAGVKIYEYTPGFIHSKLVICDDKLAICGTFNMDYRSYYLNFECGAIIANDDSIYDMKKDYLETLKVSKRMTLEDSKVGFFRLLLRAILNVFAPLL